MNYNYLLNLLDKIKTPSYVIDEDKIAKNLDIIKAVKDKTGAQFLLAQKAFSTYQLYPIFAKIIDGMACSGLFEARLAYENGFLNAHTMQIAVDEREFSETLKYSSAIVFNSVNGYNNYAKIVKDAKKQVFLRINPMISVGEHEIYDPCRKNSHLGVTIENLSKINDLSLLDGVHFHNLCEQNSDVLKKTVDSVKSHFHKLLSQVKFINLGGGHHITREDYDLDLLCSIINELNKSYDAQILLEPGEAFVLNSGVLVSSVLDIIENGALNAVLDCSAACHMPDVLEMPYTPHCYSEEENGEFSYTFVGPTCLAGDIIGTYSFNHKLKNGDKIMLLDMALYTMVKNNTFNGINLPSIYSFSAKNSSLTLHKSFDYSDFKSRL